MQGARSAESKVLRAKSENPLRFALSPLPLSTLTRNRSSAPFDKAQGDRRSRWPFSAAEKGVGDASHQGWTEN